MRNDFIEVAKETIEITKNGFYELCGKKIFIEPEGFTSRFDVDLYSPDATDMLLKNTSNLNNANKNTSDCKIILQDADSFEAAKNLDSPLVLNFADAHLVGGYFLQGSTVQEESLCRCSTLYGSINSKKARAMYDYNDEKNIPGDTDYMLISPNVFVFRDKGCELLPAPFKVAVATLPAPVASEVLYNGGSKDELGAIIKHRLLKLFVVAKNCGYKNLVLGAWGCGAFGNDARQVAAIFYELLFNEGYSKYFDAVAFPVKGGGRNLAAFMDVFNK